MPSELPPLYAVVQTDQDGTSLRTPGFTDRATIELGVGLFESLRNGHTYSIIEYRPADRPRPIDLEIHRADQAHMNLVLKMYDELKARATALAAAATALPDEVKSADLVDALRGCPFTQGAPGEEGR
jgi:hypothetical protein